MGFMKKKKKKIIFRHPRSIIAEEYDHIRKNIEFSTVEHNTRSIVISSPKKGEGKSVTAANIAISFALQEKKVLLIDGHMRNPMIHSFFNIRNSIGLSHVLTEQKTIMETVNRTNVEGLHVLTAGPIPYNTEELFRSAQMNQLLLEANEYYDLIIFDAPSILENSDARLLAMKCDGVILVLKNNHTEDKAIIEAKEMLAVVNAKLIGAILNGKNPTAS